MIKFLEIEEKQSQTDIDLGVPPEFIRIDITNKTEGEIKSLFLANEPK